MKRPNRHFLALNSLHIFNDGFQASLVLLLPFIAVGQHFSLAKIGSLGTIVNIAGIALALPAGYIATKLGGLKTLLLALFIYAVGFFGAGVFTEYYALAAMFLLAGVGFGVFHPIAFGLIAKWTPKARRGRTIGNFTAIGDIGRIGISAAASFIAVGIGWQQTAMLYAAGAILLGLGATRFLRGRDAIEIKDHQPTAMTLWQIVRNRRLLLAFAAAALDSFASASLYIFLPFLLLKRGIDPALLGTFTAAFFAGNFFGKTLLGRLVDRLGNATVFIVADALMALFIFVLATATAAWLIIACSIVLGIFTKGTVPVLQTMMAEAVEHHGNYEKTFGLGALITGVAIAVAPIVLGIVSDHSGIVTAFTIMAATALLAVVPGVVYALIRTPKTPQEES